MSSPTGTPSSKATAGLTPRDIELLAFAMQSMRDPNVQLDYDKFAELAGLTGGSARVIWGKIRRKLAAASSVDRTPASAASQSGKLTAKGARKRKAGDDGDGNGGTIGSPQSPTAMAAERRKKRVKKSPKADVSAQESEEERGVQVKAEDGVSIKDEQ